MNDPALQRRFRLVGPPGQATFLAFASGTAFGAIWYMEMLSGFISRLACMKGRTHDPMRLASMITVRRLPPRMKISQQPQPAYRRWLAAAWQLGLLAGGGLVVVFVFGGLVMSGLQFVGVSTTIALLVGLTAGCVFVIYNFDWSEIWSDVVAGLSRSSAEADVLQVIDQVVVSNIKKAWEFDCDCLDDFWPGYLLALQDGTFLAVWGQALDQVVDYDYDDDVCLFQEIVLDIDVSTKEILNVNWSGERIQMSGLIPFGPLGLEVSDGFSVVPAEVAQSVIAQGIHYPGD